MTTLREAAQMALQALQESKPIDIDDPAAFYRSAHAIEALRAALAQPEQDPVWGDSQVTKPEVIAGQKAMNEGLRKMVEQEPVAWMYDWYDETEDIDGVPIGGIVSDCISKDYDEAHSPTMGCHNIRPLYTAPPQQLEQEIEPDRCHVEDDGCPTEKAVLQRFWREHQKQEPVGIIETKFYGTPTGQVPYTHARIDKFLYSGTKLYAAPPQREWQGLTDEERKEIIRRQKDFWGPVGWELECAKAVEDKLREKNT